MKCKFKVGDVVFIHDSLKTAKTIHKINEFTQEVSFSYIETPDLYHEIEIDYINAHKLVPGFGTKLYKALS